MIRFNDSGITCKVLLYDGKEAFDEGTDVHVVIVECGPGLSTFPTQLRHIV